MNQKDLKKIFEMMTDEAYIKKAWAEFNRARAKHGRLEDKDED